MVAVADCPFLPQLYGKMPYMSRKSADGPAGLADRRKLKSKPTRPDCACSAEADIGVYDTCIYGCRYSYGSRNQQAAMRNFRSHDTEGACILR